MKHLSYILFSILLVTMSVVLNSCGKDDEPSSKDKYFVKYELKTSSQYSFSNVLVEVTTENGIQKLDVSRNWDGTFGPFEYGSPLIFKVTKENDYYALTKFTGRISVSKNNEPFVLKAEKQANGEALSMTYTIDF